MALYRNERIPPYEFVNRLKQVDKDLYVVFDSISMRWDILYKTQKDGSVHVVHKVCERDDEGRDVGYMPLDERTIRKLLRMDLKRRNISPKVYKQKVNDAEEIRELKKQTEYDEHMDYVYRHEHRVLERSRDALRGVYRST